MEDEQFYKDYVDAVQLVSSSKKVLNAIDKIGSKNFAGPNKDYMLKQFKDYFYGEFALTKKENIVKAYRNNKVEFLAIRVILNQVESTSSPFYKLFRKNYTYVDTNKKGYNIVPDDQFGIVRDFRASGNFQDDYEGDDYEINTEDIVDEEVEQEDYEQIHSSILSFVNKLHWHYKFIWTKKYVDNKTVKEISEETGINKNTLYFNLHTINDLIRKHIKELYPDSSIHSNIYEDKNI